MSCFFTPASASAAALCLDDSLYSKVCCTLALAKRRKLTWRGLRQFSPEKYKSSWGGEYSLAESFKSHFRDVQSSDKDYPEMHSRLGSHLEAEIT